MNLYGLFKLDVNIYKVQVFSNLYRHINVPMAFKELKQTHLPVDDSDKQCNCNRSDLLYEICSKNLSLVLGVYTSLLLAVT